tara:strand:- start:166 stop:636 length:471 start_codon:yes stop_codon:yes gene_type:complete
MRLRIIITLIFSCILISSCKTTVSKETVGKIAGSIQGGIIGSQFGKGQGKLISIAAGTMLGSIIGGTIGKYLDDKDKEIMLKTTKTMLENENLGEQVSWQNPDTGNKGTVKANKSFKNNKNQLCKEFSQTVSTSKITEKSYGTACRQADGSWKIIK